MIVRSLVVLFILCALSSAALAQSCAPEVKPEEGRLGYRKRAMPERCEGMYSMPFRGASFEMLSFGSGISAFDPKTDQTLVISAPDVSALAAPNVTVLGRALSPFTFYRLDAKVPSGGSIRWPVGDVVLAAGLDPKDIGLTGSVVTGQGTILVPVAVLSAKGVASGNTANATITFRVSSDLDAFEWRLYAVGDTPKPYTRRGGAIHAGDLVRLSLDLQPARVMMLDVAARPSGGDFTTLRLKVYRP